MLKSLKLSFAFFALALIGILISYDRVMIDARTAIYKMMPSDYIIDEPIEYGIPLEKHFTIDNPTENKKFFKILWVDLENDYPKEAITYKLEYREPESNNWTVVDTAQEYVPSSLTTQKEALAKGLTIEKNSSLEFKLTLINENPKGENVDSTFRTSITISNYVLANLYPSKNFPSSGSFIS